MHACHILPHSAGTALVHSRAPPPARTALSTIIGCVFFNDAPLSTALRCATPCASQLHSYLYSSATRSEFALIAQHSKPCTGRALLARRRAAGMPSLVPALACVQRLQQRAATYAARRRLWAAHLAFAAATPPRQICLNCCRRLRCRCGATSLRSNCAPACGEAGPLAALWAASGRGVAIGVGCALRGVVAVKRRLPHASCSSDGPMAMPSCGGKRRVDGGRDLGLLFKPPVMWLPAAARQGGLSAVSAAHSRCVGSCVSDCVRSIHVACAGGAKAPLATQSVAPAMSLHVPSLASSCAPKSGR